MKTIKTMFKNVWVQALGCVMITIVVIIALRYLLDLIGWTSKFLLIFTGIMGFLVCVIVLNPNDSIVQEIDKDGNIKPSKDSSWSMYKVVMLLH